MCSAVVTKKGRSDGDATEQPTLDAYSGASRTPIPIQVGQVFRFKSDTDSGEVGHLGRSE